ncbi:MAG: hypothetical protein R2710_05555 [Acidimicrobiales bacterium]
MTGAARSCDPRAEPRRRRAHQPGVDRVLRRGGRHGCGRRRGRDTVLDADADGEYRTVGFFAKRARGPTMAGWIITERIKSVRAMRDAGEATASIPNVRRLIDRSFVRSGQSRRRRPIAVRRGTEPRPRLEQRLDHHNRGTVEPCVAQLEFESEQSQDEVGDEDIPGTAIPPGRPKATAVADHIEDLELVGILVER